MRLLTSRRRHPAAKALLLMFALFLVGALYTVVAPAARSSADPTTTQQVEQGKQLFAVQCSSCHGLNGEGQQSGMVLGPSLVGVGEAAVDFQVGTGRMPMANPGPQAQKRANRFTDQEVAALAAYVASLGPGPAIPAAASYTNDGLSAEELARGGEIFRTNCSACHNYEGAGGALPTGKYAPSLIGVSGKHIYEAMITGPQQMPVFSDSVLTPKDKTELIAYLQTLQERPNDGGLGLGSLGPVAEGFWAWIVGIGGLIAFAAWIAAKGVRSR
ncbi:MAG: cytochrome bc1 complex diheme cytochrome c subunit [Propionibacteriaceae bacterium]